jgi:hypothetical protein
MAHRLRIENYVAQGTNAYLPTTTAADKDPQLGVEINEKDIVE